MKDYGREFVNYLKAIFSGSAVGFTIAGGTTSKTLTVTADTSLDEAVAMSSKAPKVSPSLTTPSLGVATATSVTTLDSFATMSGPITQTMFSVTAASCHIVFITQGAEFYQATGIVSVAEGSGTAELFGISSTNADLQLAVSGLNVQVYQGIGSPRTVKWRTLRLY